MWKCETCDRHVLPVVQVCPFCTATRVASLSAAIVTPIVLSACYGAPPCTPGQLVDADNDGFSVAANGAFCWPTTVEDCDDSNAAVNPDAEEICDDGIDNNCDGIEAAPNQREFCNGLDDDCDGEVDEDGACDPWTPDSSTGDTGEPPEADAAMSLSLNWSAGATSCEEAGVQTLEVRLVPQLGAEPTVTRRLDCADGATVVPDLPVGAWLVDASAVATDGVRTWASAPMVVSLGADTTLPVTLSLECTGCTAP